MLWVNNSLFPLFCSNFAPCHSYLMRFNVKSFIYDEKKRLPVKRYSSDICIW